MIDIKSALHHALFQLTSTSLTPRVDAELLLGHALHRSRAYLYSHPEQPLLQADMDAFNQLLEKRVTGYPIAYLLGQREFWSLPLSVNETTLIPRPETELLVELALTLLNNVPDASLLDLGTGSGAIALALGSERPDWQILACDYSEAALEMAKRNASALCINNVRFLHSDWFSSIPEQTFDAIVSNPPYIAAEDPHVQQGDLRFEPKDALISGVQGLDAISYLAQHSQLYLKPGGLFLLEHGFEQRQAVNDILQQNGYEQVQCWQDSQGHDRVSGGYKKR